MAQVNEWRTPTTSRRSTGPGSSVGRGSASQSRIVRADSGGCHRAGGLVRRDAGVSVRRHERAWIAIPDAVATPRIVATTPDSASSDSADDGPVARRASTGGSAPPMRMARLAPSVSGSPPALCSTSAPASPPRLDRLGRTRGHRSLLVLLTWPWGATQARRTQISGNPGCRASADDVVGRTTQRSASRADGYVLLRTLTARSGGRIGEACTESRDPDVAGGAGESVALDVVDLGRLVGAVCRRGRCGRPECPRGMLQGDHAPEPPGCRSRVWPCEARRLATGLTIAGRRTWRK